VNDNFLRIDFANIYDLITVSVCKFHEFVSIAYPDAYYQNVTRAQPERES